MAEDPRSIPFDFITDESLRKGLEADYREMTDCADAGAWKAVHLLAGSIIEAVLVDYLIGTAKQRKPDPMSMGMADLISAGRKAHVLSKKSADLSGALKEYRNLIHPGRAKRLNELPDREGAVVAQSLVRLIVREISEKQASERGFTAEQISRKFASDPSAANISEHLLKDANDREIERLLVEVVPDVYFAELEEEYPDSGLLKSQADLYQSAFDYAPDDVKRAAMSAYVKVLREASGPRVQIYERQFFQGSHLSWVAPDDLDLAKKHLLSQLEDADVALLEAARGVGGYLAEDEVDDFIDPLVRVCIRYRNRPQGAAARKLIVGEYSHTPSEIDEAIVSRIDSWIRAYENRGEQGEPLATLLREIRADYDIPF